MNAAGGLAQLAGNELLHARDLFSGGRIGLEELFSETDGAEGQTDGFADAFAVGERDFAASTAYVDQHTSARGSGLVAHHAAMDKAAFFEAGDDLDVPAGFIAHPGKKGTAVAGVAHGRGSHRAHLVGAMHLDRLVKPLEGAKRGRHGLRRHQAGLKNTSAEARDLAVFMNY